MTDKDLNQRQGYIESDHEEKNSLQQQRHKYKLSKNILDIRYEDLRRKVIEAEENKPKDKLLKLKLQFPNGEGTDKEFYINLNPEESKDSP